MFVRSDGRPDLKGMWDKGLCLKDSLYTRQPFSGTLVLFQTYVLAPLCKQPKILGETEKLNISQKETLRKTD